MNHAVDLCPCNKLVADGVSECVGLMSNLTQQVIPETSLSRQSIALVLTTKHKERKQYIGSEKNDTDVAHYNFKAHQPISAIFGRGVAERVCYQMVICYPTSPD